MGSSHDVIRNWLKSSYGMDDKAHPGFSQVSNTPLDSGK